MRNTLIGETPLLSAALASIAALLPASWQLHPTTDGALTMVGPNGARVEFAVEARRVGSVPVRLLIAGLMERDRRTDAPLLFASDYIGPKLREALTNASINFADATGWVRVALDEPLILVIGQGDNRSPRSPERLSAVRRLDGVAANRIIRALTTTETPVGVRALAKIAGVSAGSVSKLLVTLSAESIVDRAESGAVTTVGRRALIRRWAQDYAFARSNLPVRYGIAPRGLDRVMIHVAEQPGVVITGSAAARRLLAESATSVVPIRLLALYSADPVELTKSLGIIDADPASANVVIARPQDVGILRPNSDNQEDAVAPVSQVLVDLLTLPGRSDAEAEQLMDALAANDPAWRT